MPPVEGTAGLGRPGVALNNRSISFQASYSETLAGAALWEISQS